MKEKPTSQGKVRKGPLARLKSLSPKELSTKPTVMSAAAALKAKKAAKYDQRLARLEARLEKKKERLEIKKAKDPTFAELVLESFTTGDNHDHNEGIGSQPLWTRIIFILTNVAYLLCAYVMHSKGQTPNPVSESLDNFCSIPSINYLSAAALSIISATFHTKQCFFCRDHKEVASCVWWNEIDLHCAALYGLYIGLCFFKKSLLYFVPCLLSLVGGGVLKLLGYYRVYFFLHGTWHISCALFMAKVVCEP